jgi:hypothetical protein
VWVRAARGWEVCVPLLAASILYGVFITRSGFHTHGSLYFTLFDDAMVSMRYAHNLVHGHGLVWNIGEPVEGYSNLGWTLWMAALHLTGVSEAKASLLVMLSGAALLIGNLLLVRAIVRRMIPDTRLAVFVVLVLTAFFYPLVYWTLRGMEVGLIALILSALCLQAMRTRERPSLPNTFALAGIMAAGVLTRDDLIVPCIVVTVFVSATVPRGRRAMTVAVLVGGLALVVGAHTAFRLIYYGDPLPNTYYLKVAGASPWDRGRLGVLRLLDLFVAQIWAPFMLAAVGLFVGRKRPDVWLLTGIFSGQVAYSAVVGGDVWEWMHIANRFVAPAMPLLFILAALGITAIVNANAQQVRAVMGRASATVLFVVILVLVWPLDYPTRRFVPVLSGAGDMITRALVAALCGAVLVAAVRAVGRGSLSGPLLVVVLLLTVLVATNGPAYREWLTANAVYVHHDAYMAKYGLFLRDNMSNTDSVAVVWAGAIPYFSKRRAIDVLGKNDRVIAHGPSHRPFAPGHSKWNTEYSIGRLRPDVIAQYWSEDDARYALALGYRRLPGGQVPSPPRTQDPKMRCCGFARGRAYHRLRPARASAVE